MAAPPKRAHVVISEGMREALINGTIETGSLSRSFHGERSQTRRGTQAKLVDPYAAIPQIGEALTLP